MSSSPAGGQDGVAQPSRFYLIVGSTEHLEAFLAAGVRAVQLRIKSPDAATLRDEVRCARELCADHGATLWLNDHWRLALDEGVGAVHLGQGDLDTADVAALRAHRVRLGLSTHDRSELARAQALQPDYIALGPIYATTLKEMPWCPQGLPKLQRWKCHIGNTPLVAIGGFTPDRAAGAFAHGADSVCVVTDVLQHIDPVARVREWLSVCAA